MTSQYESRAGCSGTIETSSGYGDVLEWPGGTYGASAPVTAAEDECILHHVDTAPNGYDARHLSVNADGDVWVGENMPLSDMRGETAAQLAVVLALPPAERAAALERGEDQHGDDRGRKRRGHQNDAQRQIKHDDSPAAGPGRGPRPQACQLRLMPG